MHLKKSDLEKVSRELLSASWGVFSWKWDHRFEAFLAEFSADNRDEFSLDIGTWFQQWYGIVQTSMKHLILYRCATIILVAFDQDSCFLPQIRAKMFFVCGAWWPWGNGRNYLSSHRIACLGVTT